MSFVLVRYVLRAAVRDRILIALLLAFIVGASLSIFMGASAVVEANQFANVFMGAALRSVSVLGLVLFVVFHVRRSFESKDVEFLLSRPVSRAQFLLSFATAFSLLAVIVGIAAGLCLLIITPKLMMPGVLLWVFSIVIENIIMVNVALFFSLMLSSAAAGAMACFGLYVFARMMGELLGIIDTGSSAGVPANKLLSVVVQAISAISPRLDLMGQTTWLIYGPDEGVSYGFLTLQGIIFPAMILCAAMIDLSRRKF